MYLYLITQLAQLVMDVFLLGLSLLALALKLNQQRATARYPENSVWVPGGTRRDKLRADDPEVLPHQVNGVSLNLRLKEPHQPRPFFSAADWQCTHRTRPISMRSSGTSSPQSKQV
jgi:hypothetical protein